MITLYIFLAFLAGAAVMFAALYPQLKLFCSMLTDRHAAELGKLGIKPQNSAVNKISRQQDEKPESPSSDPNKVTTNLVPPSIFDSRAKAEAEMVKVDANRRKMLALVDEM